MSTTRTMSFTDLPPEVVSTAISFLDHDTLAQTRLTCKSLCDIATRHLFRELTLYPRQTSLEDFIAVTDSSNIAPHVRKIKLFTFFEPETTYHDMGQLETDEFWRDWDEGEDDEDDDEDDDVSIVEGEDDWAWVNKEFARSLSRLAQLQGLTEVEIVFTQDCEDNANSMWLDVAEPRVAKCSKLLKIFNALQGVDSLRSLRITNLHNVSDEELVASSSFSRVLGKLSELQLHSVQKDDPHGPDHDQDEEQLFTFPPYLRKHYLGPFSSQLTSLTLSHATCWGSVPGYFAPQDLDLPCLRRLALGNYTIAHNDQFDWVLRLKTLKDLELKSCSITALIAHTHEQATQWQMPTHDWVELYREDHCKYWSYDGCWSTLLDRVRNELCLTSFSFQFGDLYEGRSLGGKMYTGFDFGSIPAWLSEEECREGFMDRTPKDRLSGIGESSDRARDLDALQKLIDATAARRRTVK